MAGSAKWCDDKLTLPGRAGTTDRPAGVSHALSVALGRAGCRRLLFLFSDQVGPRKRIARHLGISLRTLQRYAASGNTPRAVYLTLWFESR